MGVYNILIGNVYVQRTAALAPMAGLGDSAFRCLCKRFGASYMVGEMVSAKGISYNSSKTLDLLCVNDEERPVAIQLFGADPDTLAQAAREAMAYSPDVIDINMGCPAPKISGGGGGAALMRDPPLAGRITRAVVNAVPVPVTVKFRKGWDSESVNAVDFARRMEDNGAAALTIHGRTREQFYSLCADWDIIAAVKQAVMIPVIGNGDCTTASDIVRMYGYTGCDLVMVGRGALGNPWIFSQARELILDGTTPKPPCARERMEVMLRHFEAICANKGEARAMREARRHAGYYLRGFHKAASLRRMAGMLTTLDDARELARYALELAESAGGADTIQWEDDV